MNFVCTFIYLCMSAKFIQLLGGSNLSVHVTSLICLLPIATNLHVDNI